MYKKFYLKPGQKAPAGSTGKATKDGGIIWKGEVWKADDIEVQDMAAEEIDEHLQSDFERALDTFIDSVAQAKGYDSRITCVMRTGYQNPWQEEAVAFGKWMDSCYSKAIEIIDKVKSGKKQMPTKESFLAEMPEMVWPSGEPLPGLEDIK
jgi:hypothetical protein